MRIPLNPNAKLRKVEAPNLRYLGCSTPAKSESLIDLINHLVVQSNCCLNVRIIDILHNLPEIISKLFGYIRDRINRLDQTFSVGLHLDSAWAGGLALKCPPTNPVIFARFSWEFPELGIEPELRHIADELEPAFRDTRELRFSSERSSDAELSLPKLANVFTQRLPRLSRLAVPSVPWVLAYLTDPEPEHGCISPNLQHLRQLGGEWQPRLLELLESRRREPGVKTIETIVLENARVDPSNLEALKELVGEVVVETTR
ncbi:hypothetical protein FS837_000834 [Tulasnella sp. UAMH 9824]|nr:hypothetical protein FS837_000834 [Tulasnella sp. UAMH 9824]